MKVQLVMIVLSILLSVSPCIALDQDTHMKFRLPLSGLWMLRGSLEEMQWSTFIPFSVQNHPLKRVQVAIKKGTVGCCRFQRHRVRCMNATGGGSVDQVLLCWSVQQTGACGNL